MSETKLRYRCLACGAVCNEGERFCSPKCRGYGMEVLAEHGLTEIPTNSRLVGFKYFCAICGSEIESHRRTIYCSDKCAKQGVVSASQRQKDREYATELVARRGQDPKRKCHDCGKPTTDYRCAKCLKKWRKKHNLAIQS